MSGERLFAIGDVHGCLTALDALLKAVPMRPQDTVVMLGDYVDRGPDSRGVIQRLFELSHRVNLVTLMGNHEIMMLHARTDEELLRSWLRFGGDATLRSYGAKSVEQVPPAHWEFLEACLPYFETEQHIFVHANLNPVLPLAEQTDEQLFWERFVAPPPHCSGKIMVCGHTHQPSGKPADLGHAICIDTHAYGGGWLTCLEVRSRMYWRANQAGVVKTNALA